MMEKAVTKVSANLNISQRVDSLVDELNSYELKSSNLKHT